MARGKGSKTRKASTAAATKTPGGDPAAANPQGADLQTAFANAISALQSGEMKHASIQFGFCYVAAEIALPHQEPEMQTNLRQYLWQCALYRAACLTTFESPREHEEAQKCLQQCIQLAEALQDTEKLAEALGLTASLQARMGQCEAALTTLDRLAALATEHALATYAQVALVHRGTALTGLQRFGEAIAALARAEQMAADAGDKRAEGNACIELAKAYSAAGKGKPALLAGRRALGLAESEGDFQRVQLVQAQLAKELAFVE
uniref:Uncharacterized protein n=1 Tax=Pyramimonas obovata TaxID=1411642 RepID=A0A7S0WPP1_9CHLO|mmetsp:Transcript_33598/g.73334  ORF Transcript_33598/g.73334 Transcript_33598/m.73334 type:complete len:263 (+) Transcript_33598:260-1048(+)|eukprot:CAMPEP_0118926204 /NCGR_PEP_ID=MMETSP1169-20130426/3956_1 /TAXON_ID=36882 /ORGANISM="Pyramimonas obovata, Strain CCMP722" /LENGTH=262 /DNA_ID=CAMNT_0006867707 /DNA_START=190 /DNA_END=978 /DNA_ORIENTATION=-